MLKLAVGLLAWARTTPMWRAFAADRLLGYVFLALSLTAVLPLFFTPFIPFTDLGFNAQAGLLPHILFGDDFLNEWYKVYWAPVPYWSSFTLQALFTLLVGPTLAVKVTVGLVTLLMPLSLMRLAIALGRDPRIAVLGFALMWDKNAYWGWTSFQLGMALCIWTLAKLAECRTFRQAFWLWPWAMLVGVSHVHAITLLAVAGGVIALAGRPFRPLLLVRVVALSATLLPVGLWLSAVLSRARTGPLAPFQFNGPPLWERISAVFTYTLDNYRLPFHTKWAWWTFVIVVATPLVLAFLPRRSWLESKDRARGNNRLLVVGALFAASLVLYCELPFSVSGSLNHWWTYPRYATYAILGALLLPRPNLSGWRGLALVPALVGTFGLHLIMVQQFRTFADSVRPFLEIEPALPPHQRLYPVSFQMESPAVHGWPVIALHGYLTMEKRAYDPHLFQNHDTPVHFRKHLAQHDWTNPRSFRFDYAKDYDYILLYQATHKPLRAALREGRVTLVKESGPWELYRVKH